MQGFDSKIEQREATIGKNFNFLMFNVQFVFIVCSAMWSNSRGILFNPVAWSETIASSIPAGASFFINYLILNSISLSLELLRPFALFYFALLKSFANTPRQFYKIEVDTSHLNYGFIFPLQILLFCVSLCYCIISPLILIPGVLYFGIAWLVYKNQLMYVYVKTMECNGRFWLMAYSRCIIGLAVFQFVMTGLLSAQGAPVAASLCALLVPLTYFTHYYIEANYSRQIRQTPLELLPANRQVDTPLDRRISISVINSPRTTQAIVNVEDHHASQAASSYLSPAYSKAFSKLWIPEYLASLAGEKLDMEVEQESHKLKTGKWISLQALSQVPE